MKKLLILSLGLLATSTCFAALSPLNSSNVTKAFSDKTITTVSAATLDGKLISDSFSGYLHKDGKVDGKFRSKPASGPDTDQGTWMVKKDGKLCVTWEHWNEGKEKCTAIYSLSNAFLIVNKDNGFESLVLKSDIKSGNQL